MESQFREAVAELDASLVASPFVRALVERVAADVAAGGTADPYAVIRAVEALAAEADAGTLALVAERDRLRAELASRADRR